MAHTAAVPIETQASPAEPERSAGEPERGLIERARNGDTQAFEELYKAHSPRVYALCLRLTGHDRDAATVLLQDVFVSAWRALPGFRGDAPLATWLHRLAVNGLLQTVRAGRRREARVLPVDDPAKWSAPGRGADPGLVIDLEQAIAGLPDGARTAFVLHHVEGYQYQEIAEQLGIAVGTVKAQVHRACLLLMRALDR